VTNQIDPDVTNLVLGASIKLAKEFLSKIVTPPAEELGELLADQVRWFRFSNQIRILNKARDKLSKSGISPHKVPLRILLPLLDNGSWEEEEDMIDRWANLLANAANPNYSSNVEIGYIETLKQLSPKEALIMDRLYAYYNERLAEGKARGAEPSAVEVPGAELQVMTGVEKRDFEIAMDNLYRLNLLSSPGVLWRAAQPEEDFYSGNKEIKIQFTRFGYSFVSACRAGT